MSPLEKSVSWCLQSSSANDDFDKLPASSLFRREWRKAASAPIFFFLCQIQIGAGLIPLAVP